MPAVRIALVHGLARAAGLGGMVGGQMLDLAAEGRFGDDDARCSRAARSLTLQAMKTGALILLRLRRRRDPRRRADAPARDALDRYGAGDRPGVPDRRRPARRRGRRRHARQGGRQGRRRRQGDAGRSARRRRRARAARRNWSRRPRARWRRSAPKPRSLRAAARFVAERQASASRPIRMSHAKAKRPHLDRPGRRGAQAPVHFGGDRHRRRRSSLPATGCIGDALLIGWDVGVADLSRRSGAS